MTTEKTHHCKAFLPRVGTQDTAEGSAFTREAVCVWQQPNPSAALERLLLVVVVVIIILILIRSERVLGILEGVVVDALGARERERRLPPRLRKPVGLALPSLHLALAFLRHRHRDSRLLRPHGPGPAERGEQAAAQ